MSLPSITIEDFRGPIRLAFNEFEKEEFPFYVQRYYPYFLKQFIGDAAFNEIKNFPESNTNPLPRKWTDLLNGRTYYNTNLDRNVIVESLIEVVKRCIYLAYTRDYTLHTLTGFVRNDSENAINASPEEIASRALLEYNSAIKIYNQQTVPFICEYERRKEEITNFVYDGSNWVISTPCTEYLLIGDTVTIDNEEYEVIGLESNVSFSISAPIGFTIICLEYVYEPYEIVEYCRRANITW